MRSHKWVIFPNGGYVEILKNNPKSGAAPAVPYIIAYIWADEV